MMVPQRFGRGRGKIECVIIFNDMSNRFRLCRYGFLVR